MTSKEIRKELMRAFGVHSISGLQNHLANTDLQNRDELLHAAAVVWNYPDGYDVQDFDSLEYILDSQTEQKQRQLAIDAKHGFGYCEDNGL